MPVDASLNLEGVLLPALLIEFEDILNHVVGEWILNEVERVLGYLECEVSPLLGRPSVVDALLHDAAAVLVAGDLLVVFQHGLVDEVILVCLPGMQDLLDHVVAIDVFGEVLQNLRPQVLRNGVVMIWQARDLNQLLDRASAVGILAGG